MPRKWCKVGHHTRIRCKVVYIISRKYDAVLCARKIRVAKFEKQIKLYENSENLYTRPGPGPVNQLGPYNQAGSSSTGRRIELPSLKKTVNTYVH